MTIEASFGAVTISDRVVAIRAWGEAVRQAATSFEPPIVGDRTCAHIADRRLDACANAPPPFSLFWARSLEAGRGSTPSAENALQNLIARTSTGR
jgi:hypothetical protein